MTSDLANTLGSPRGHDEQATYVVAPSSPASAGSTTDSPELGFDTPSSVSRTLGGEASSPITSPESRSTRTYALSENLRHELRLTDIAMSLAQAGGKPGQGYQAVVTLPSSAADSLAKTYPWLAGEQDLQESDQASSTSSPESLSLFDPDGFSSRTYPVSSLLTAVGTSEQSLERWPTSGTAWPGGFSTHATSECRSDEGGCSSSEPSLSEILEEPQNVPARYSLSARAASGILRRAQKRGRTLPSHLQAALLAVAGSETELRTTSSRGH